MQRDLEISPDCRSGGGGDEVGVGRRDWRHKGEGEREVEMTIPFAEHNASHFETTIEARKGHFVGKRERGRAKFQRNKKTPNLNLNLLLEISLPLDT